MVTTVRGGIGPSELLRFPAAGCGAPTCTPTWTASLPGFPGGQVAAAEDVLVVSSSTDPLLVFPEHCTDPCTPTFDLEGDTFWGAPLIDSGRIWVTRRIDGDQEVVALRPTG